MSAAAPDKATAEDIYQDVILDRARKPRHQRRLEAVSVSAEERNPLCGDRVFVELDVTADGRVAALGYRARACAICVAAADLMAEIVPGMAVTEVGYAAESFEAALRKGAAIPAESSIAALGVFTSLHATPSRIQCALLAWRAVTTALAQRQ